MTIENATQFANFISKTGISNVDSAFQQIVTCINNYRASCNCYKSSDKTKIYSECNRLYHLLVTHNIYRVKREIFSKTSDGEIVFKNDNGSIISIVHR